MSRRQSTQIYTPTSVKSRQLFTPSVKQPKAVVVATPAEVPSTPYVDFSTSQFATWTGPTPSKSSKTPLRKLPRTDHLDTRILCPVCCQPFNQPVKLECGHTVCHGCLESHTYTARTHDTSGRAVPSECPVCFAATLTQKQKRIEDDITRARLCSECNLEQIAVKCVDCEQEYCTACDQKIHSFKTLGNHYRIPLDRPSTGEMMCVQHPSRLSTVYCQQLSVPLCTVCETHVSHLGHQHTPALEAAAQLAALLSTTVQEGTDCVVRARERLKESDTLRDQIQAQYAKTGDEMEAFREKLHVLVDRSLDRVLGAMEYCAKLREARVEQAQTELQKKLGTANLSIASARQQSSHRERSDLLYLGKSLQQKVVTDCQALDDYVRNQYSNILPTGGPFPAVVIPIGLEHTITRLCIRPEQFEDEALPEQRDARFGALVQAERAVHESEVIAQEVMDLGANARRLKLAAEAEAASVRVEHERVLDERLAKAKQSQAKRIAQIRSDTRFDSDKPGEVYCKLCRMVVAQNIRSLQEGDLHPTGLHGFLKEHFINVRFIRDCCTNCHTLCCGGGHPIGKWSERAAAGYQPHLLYLSEMNVGVPWSQP